MEEVMEENKILRGTVERLKEHMLANPKPLPEKIDPLKITKGDDGIDRYEEANALYQRFFKRNSTLDDEKVSP